MRTSLRLLAAAALCAAAAAAQVQLIPLPDNAGVLTQANLDALNADLAMLAAASGGGGGSSAFGALTGGTNSSAAMVVGSGASLSASGSGTIAATAAPVAGITGLGTGIATWLATPTNANLAAAMTLALAGPAFANQGTTSTVLHGNATGNGSFTSVVPGDVSSAQGNGAKFQFSTGTTAANDCVKFDANGNTVDAGAACGSGSGGITSTVSSSFTDILCGLHADTTVSALGTCSNAVTDLTTAQAFAQTASSGGAIGANHGVRLTYLIAWEANSGTSPGFTLSLYWGGTGTNGAALAEYALNAPPQYTAAVYTVRLSCTVIATAAAGSSVASVTSCDHMNFNNSGSAGSGGPDQQNQINQSSGVNIATNAAANIYFAVQSGNNAAGAGMKLLAVQTELF
jgi:hypothetical protein